MTCTSSRLLAAVIVVMAGVWPIRARAATFDEAARLVVMIESEIEGRMHPGAGVLFAVSGNRVYVFTANHVVRDTAGEVARRVDVYFRDLPRSPHPARVLDDFDAGADLAVIEIGDLQPDDMVALNGDRPLPFGLIGPSGVLPRGAKVFPVGYPGGTVDWASPLTPDGVDRQTGDQLLFQSSFVREGHSGGGLFSDDWHLVGMVLEVAQAPIVRALPVNAILERLRRWNHAVGIVTGAPPARVVESSSAPVSPVAPVPLRERALVEDTTGDGRSVISVTSWGRIAGGSAGQWATVRVSGATGLPGGAADLVLMLRDTRDMQFAIKEDRQASGGPLQVDALGDVGVRLVKSRGFMGAFGYDRITETQRLTLRQLMAGQALRLRYTDESGGDVRLFLQAVPFEPESKSGPDQQLASAAALPRGALLEGSVAFNAGDATDHLAVPSDRAAPQSRSGVMVVRSVGTVTVASSPAGDRDLASTPVAKLVAAHRYPPEPQRTAFQKQDVRLFDIACQPDAVIRVQAPVADADGDYLAFIGRGVREPKAFSTLIDRWLRPWEDTNLQLNDGDVEAIVRGLASLRRSTAVTEADTFMAYEGYITSNFAFDKPVFERVLKHEREALEAALSRCCPGAIALRALVNVIRAEEGLPFDRRSVEGVNTIFLVDDGFKERARRVVEGTGPR